MKRGLYCFVLSFFVLIFALSAFFLVRYYSRSGKQQAVYDEIAQLVTYPATQPPLPSQEEIPEETKKDPFLWVTDPQTGEPVQVLAQYAAVYERNNHTVGWIHVPGTRINYPVMQTPQEPNYYLTRNFNRESSAHGCIYVQENCHVAHSDNVVIYGHNMRDGSMFAGLHKYQKQSFWEDHKIILFDTLTQSRTYEILAVFPTSASRGMGFSYHTFTQAATAEEFQAFVAGCKQLSLYDTGVNAVYGDQLITLSTCENTQVNGRLVVVAKLLK